MMILSQKKTASLSLFSKSSKWMTRGQNAGPHKKIRNVFFLVESNLSRPEEVFPHCFGRPYDDFIANESCKSFSVF